MICKTPQGTQYSTWHLISSKLLSFSIDFFAFVEYSSYRYHFYALLGVTKHFSQRPFLCTNTKGVFLCQSTAVILGVLLLLVFRPSSLPTSIHVVRSVSSFVCSYSVSCSCPLF